MWPSRFDSVRFPAGAEVRVTSESSLNHFHFQFVGGGGLYTKELSEVKSTRLESKVFEALKYSTKQFLMYKDLIRLKSSEFNNLASVSGQQTRNERCH